MGCGLAISEDQAYQMGQHMSAERTRTEKKNNRIVARTDQFEDRIEQNIIVLKKGQVSDIDQIKTETILQHHFFFHSLNRSQRSAVVREMIPCTVEAGTYVFKQGDLASAFFIIDKGSVVVQINGQRVKTLSDGEYFGELALIYMAPRSASIKALKKTSMWCLTRTSFRRTLQQCVKRNYEISKQNLKFVSFLNFLNDRQKDSIAYHMLNLKYEDHEIIYKVHDDANSFYVVVEGSVEVSDSNSSTTYKVGQFFGQQSLEDGNVRLKTATSIGKSVCLSIGRDVVKNLLGDKASNIMIYNNVKKAIESSEILCKLSDVEIQKILQVCKLQFFKQGEIVFAKGTHPDCFAVCLEGTINGKGENYLIGEDMLTTPAEKNYIKEGGGLVVLIKYHDIESIAKKRIHDIHLIEKQTRYETRMRTTRQFYPKMDIRLEKLAFISRLGEGQFGKVYLVQQSIHNPKLYALKCIDKEMIVSYNMERIVQEEKKILQQLDCPMALTYYRSFKSQNHVFFLTQYIKGKDLFDTLREIRVVTKNIARFFISCLLIAIEYLHLKNIIYRDLKPENVMVENNGYLKLIDMGTAKKLTESKGFRTFTIIGTPHYMAPEVMKGKGYSFAVDIWTLGVMLYQFLCYRLPFGDSLSDPCKIHQKILNQELEFPSEHKDSIDQSTRRIIEQMMNKIPELRLAKGFASLKAMSFFDGFSWDDLYDKVMKSPYVPSKSSGNSKGVTTFKSVLDALKEQPPGEPFRHKQSKLPGWDEQFA